MTQRSQRARKKPPGTHEPNTTKQAQQQVSRYSLRLTVSDGSNEEEQKITFVVHRKPESYRLELPINRIGSAPCKQLRQGLIGIQI